MDVLECIRGRRSVRRFERRDIPPGDIELLKEALIWAPSSGNLQKRLFYFVFNEEAKASLVRAALGQRFILDAPLAVVGCADHTIEDHYGTRGVELYSIQDVAVSLQNMMLMAWSLGLGSTWVGAFNEKDAARSLGIPGHLRPVAIVPIGYPQSVPKPPRRVSAADAIVEVR